MEIRKKLRSEERQFGRESSNTISRIEEINSELKSNYDKDDNKTRNINSNELNKTHFNMKTDKFRYENDKTFVGRDIYIDKKIKDKFIESKIVSIVGIGGAGKTQLAYKAMHKYQEEGMFDVVIPIYFSKDVPSLSDFLTDIAEKIEISIEEFDKYDIETKKRIIWDTLSSKKIHYCILIIMKLFLKKLIEEKMIKVMKFLKMSS